MNGARRSYGFRPARPMAVERPCYGNVTGSTLTPTTKDERGKPPFVGRWRRQVAIDAGRGYGEFVGLLLDGGASHLMEHTHVVPGAAEVEPPSGRSAAIRPRAGRSRSDP